MVMKSLNVRKRNKIDTDKYEVVWHQLNGHEAFVMSVWESPTYVGPEAYNAGHIDYILDNNSRNDVRHIIAADDGRFLCRRALDKWRVKFIP